MTDAEVQERLREQARMIAAIERENRRLARNRRKSGRAPIRARRSAPPCWALVEPDVWPCCG